MQKWQKLGYLQILLKRLLLLLLAGNSLITARRVLLNARFNNNYLRRASQSVKEAIKDGGAHNAVITRSIGRAAPYEWIIAAAQPPIYIKGKNFSIYCAYIYDVCASLDAGRATGFLFVCCMNTSLTTYTQREGDDYYWRENACDCSGSDAGLVVHARVGATTCFALLIFILAKPL
jgi:hypothetical protein